ncbi:MAG: kinase/pyrophosphorylase [Anaerolineae bacterium]|nr:kinase/pyrophosphorylase [Anaerolineae bacterium]
METTPCFHLLTDSEDIDPAPLVSTALKASRIAEPSFCRYSQAKTRQDVAQAFRAASQDGGIVIHALVDNALRQAANFFSRTLGVPALDIMGPIILKLTDLLNVLPSSHPDLFRHLDEDYFRRIEAIEFAVAHDDGLRPHEAEKAEIVLVGVSRTSKTPLSMYMATHGWLVANIPIVLNMEPPPQLFELDRRKVFALTIHPERLALLRRVRITRLGLTGPENYADLDYVRSELQYAREIFRRGGWPTVDVTSKSIEETAAEIIHLRNEHFQKG